MHPKSQIKVKRKTYNLPIYLPDATRGVVKSVDKQDLLDVKVQGVVVNTYHLKHTPGTDYLDNMGGIKTFMDFGGLVVSDSGGWQVFSLLKRGNLRAGKVTDAGVIFNLYGKKELFTPEISIQTQFSINSDIVICLDDFVDPKSNYIQTKDAVLRTSQWAKRSKQEYIKQCEIRNLSQEARPLLFCVIQGGYEKDLRKLCAEELLNIGFDGFGFGGYAIDETTNALDLNLSEYIANLIPNEYFRFALGVGKPDDIKNCYKMGWELFDCTLPTKDARHQRLYTEEGYIYINKVKFKNDNNPISSACDCFTCKNYNKSYLHHLFKIKDTLALRLSTIHNLRFYTRLIETLV